MRLSSALAAALLVVGSAAGCAVHIDVDRDRTPTERVAALTPDARIVVRLVRRLQGDLDRLDRAATQYPKLDQRLSALRATEKAHLAALQGAVRAGDLPTQRPATDPVPANRRQAEQQALVAATAERAALGRAALAAESGRFAQLLGAMWAGLGQQLTALGQQPAPAPQATTPGTATTAALQTVLAGEHAAVYVLALLAAQTSQTTQKAAYDALLAAWSWHRDRRDALVGEVSAAGATPVAAEASYKLPDAPTAVRTERRVGDLYGRLVANTTGQQRAAALAELGTSAQLELGLGGAPRDLPGAG